MKSLLKLRFGFFLKYLTLLIALPILFRLRLIDAKLGFLIDFRDLNALVTLSKFRIGMLIFIFVWILVWDGKTLERAFHANLGQEKHFVLAPYHSKQDRNLNERHDSDFRTYVLDFCLGFREDLFQFFFRYFT